MMRRAGIALVMALTVAPLAACVRPPVPAAATLDRIQSDYDRVRGYAALILPRLHAARAARLRLALDTIGQALAVARDATTLIERQRALKAAEAALSTVPDPAGR